MSSLFTTYLSLIAMILLVLFPLVIPAVITGFHVFINWRRGAQPTRPLIARAVPAAA